MRKVTLQFEYEKDLRRFMQVIHCVELEVNFKSLMLKCDVDDTEIELARNAFNAILIERTVTNR
jgi:hypothetical protein